MYFNRKPHGCVLQDSASVMSYKKWLSPRLAPGTPDRSPRNSAVRPVLSPSKNDQQTSAAEYSGGDYSGRHRTKPNNNQTPRYVFLTEKDATCKGEFAQRRKELLQSKNIPKAYSGGGARSESATCVLESMRGPSRSSSLTIGKLGQVTRKKKPLFCSDIKASCLVSLLAGNEQR